MTMRSAKTLTIAALLTGSLLGACQTTASAPVVCDVSAADIEAVQTQYRAQFETVTESLAASGVNGDKAPRLKKPFKKDITETVSVSADNSNAAIGYAWRIELADGCELDARTGTNTQTASKDAKPLDVKAISFSGEKLPDGTSRFDPLKIIIAK
ncbi:hypothetical protein [Fretibacter rubidus]|uniref:hypothetical protein n=1 Tax=Fretibacter rubidus TaxID=570162 RepID=UPI003529DEBE